MRYRFARSEAGCDPKSANAVWWHWQTLRSRGKWCYSRGGKGTVYGLEGRWGADQGPCAHNKVRSATESGSRNPGDSFENLLLETILVPSDLLKSTHLALPKNDLSREAHLQSHPNLLWRHKLAHTQKVPEELTWYPFVCLSAWNKQKQSTMTSWSSVYYWNC